VARLTALADKAVARSGLAAQYSSRASMVLNIFQRRLVTVTTIGLQLAMFYWFLTFALRRFPYTRPWGETLRESMLDTLASIGLGILHGIPSLFPVFVIVVLARAVTLFLDPWFAAVERGAVTVPWMHAETAPTTRRLVNIAIWLFASAMAYPYIPGSDTDAFRGISVAVGLMFTLGSSGLVNQLMSGLVVTYSRALRPGDYVRIGEVEGTISHLGLLSTKVRTLRSEEITIPNAVVVSQTTTDFSRYPEDVLTAASITVGYSVPWRQVHALLRLAAERTPGIRRDPKPRVVQLSLEDMRVNYTLLFCLENQQNRNRVRSAVNAQILDLFNEYGVQIVTPNYEADPPQPKVVSKADWYAARRNPTSTRGEARRARGPEPVTGNPALSSPEFRWRGWPIACGGWISPQFPATAPARELLTESPRPVCSES
jgi:small-conductance mechanosensitive channel